MLFYFGMLFRIIAECKVKKGTSSGLVLVRGNENGKTLVEEGRRKKGEGEWEKISKFL